MKKMQHSESVEIAAMRSLHVSLKPSFGFDDAWSYATREVDPKMYSSPGAFKRDYAFASFLQKWKGLKDKRIKPTQKAIETWWNSERQCFRTNRRLYLESTTGSYSVAPAVIVAAQRKIAQVLGPLDVDRIAELCRFGNGATFDLPRGSSHTEKSCRPTVTLDAMPWVCLVLARDRYMASLVGPLRNLRIVSANRMVMVPKNVKTHRPIAAEPTLNSYVQQGFGRFIRERLKRFGVDLNDQTINQGLARLAKMWGLSTLDLSSASDTLCVNLVKLLLPREWFEALDAIRVKRTQYEGRGHLLSKFSSMGNACTFELESLIFYALLCAVSTTGVVSVYGDDLVVMNQDYQSTVEVLQWAGFQVNEHKSFTEGSRFYESCGKHYFDNEEVTPCYQKDVCSRPHDYVRLHNRLIRAGIRLDLREEFMAAARVVRERSATEFGRNNPGVGPLVEYDEYFIKEDYIWPDDLVDRVRIKSAITIPHMIGPGFRTKARKPEDHSCMWERRQMTAYYGRKLRQPSFSNAGHDGHVSEERGSKLLVIEKYHWRSASLR